MGMAMPSAQPPDLPEFHTADMVRALINETRPSPRYETVYGELLVTPAPAPPHQLVVGRLFRLLASYVEMAASHLHLIASPADVSWGRSDVLVQPDLFVVPIEEARAMRWDAITRLHLAIEVVSPSSRRADRYTKRRLYQDMGTPAYWLIDVEAGAVEVWTPEAQLPRVVRECVTWQPDGADDSFTLDVAELVQPL